MLCVAVSQNREERARFGRFCPFLPRRPTLRRLDDDTSQLFSSQELDTSEGEYIVVGTTIAEFGVLGFGWVVLFWHLYVSYPSLFFLPIISSVSPFCRDRTRSQCDDWWKRATVSVYDEVLLLSSRGEWFIILGGHGKDCATTRMSSRMKFSSFSCVPQMGTSTLLVSRRVWLQPETGEPTDGVSILRQKCCPSRSFTSPRTETLI